MKRSSRMGLGLIGIAAVTAVGKMLKNRGMFETKGTLKGKLKECQNVKNDKDI